ncbi:MAG: DUF1735 domain-containing protein [Bacteroidales bacterium]|nr:DUF1735 domain-containing protein [Bacteroidales bacterium]
MYRNLYKVMACAAVAMGVAACDNDDLHIAADGSASDLLGPDTNVVYVTDAQGKRGETSISINGSGTINLYLQSSKAAVSDCGAEVMFDADVLDAYNAANGTSYPLLVYSRISLPSNEMTLAAGQTKGAALPITISGDGLLDPETTYGLPLRFVPVNDQFAGSDSTMVVLVKDYSTFPGADKTYNGAPGMKMMAVLEVNDVNPLNVMGFTLKDSGKQLFDMCVLFAANININATTGLPYVYCNDNVQAILSNADTYIRPLQERGIKVVLGLLGNHDASGVSTMTPEVSAQFAQEVKTVCDVYQLDGIFLDDEYTDYDSAASGRYPGFQTRSTEAASRMLYDIKQAQPERLLISYRYQDLYSAVAINGVEPGQFVDYVVNDYWVTSDPTSTYPGLAQDQAGTGSWNCSDWSQCIPSNSSWTARFSLEGMREAGYGTMMVYNFTCNPDFWMTSYILKDLGETAKAFYDAELEYDGSWYTKDWN